MDGRDGGDESDKWTVVLTSDDSKQMVVYNEQDRQLAVRKVTRKTEVNRESLVCAMCKRPYSGRENPHPSSADYFKLLRELGKYKDNKPPLKGRKGIDSEELNQGYYEHFFKELGKLGRGSAGSVYMCQHVLSGTTLGRYAVKKVPVGDNPLWLTRMLREVHILEKLRHPNVVEYKHAWLEKHKASSFAPTVPHLFILMELAELGSLEDWLDSGPVVNVATFHAILPLLRPISQGLAYLHSHGILHRDLKPSNILLSRSGAGVIRPMISDFGEAHTQGQLEGNRTGATGTIEYMAPELYAQDKGGAYRNKHTVSSDIWSLGMLFYHCVYQRLPYNSLDFDPLLKEMLELESIDIPAEPKVPLQFRLLLSQMLSIDAAARPGLEQIVNALEAIETLPSTEGLDPRFMLQPGSLAGSFTPLSFVTPEDGLHARSLLENFAFYSPALAILLSLYSCYPYSVRASVLAIDAIAVAISVRFADMRVTLVLAFAQALARGLYPSSCAA